MKLSKAAILALKGLGRDGRAKLANEMGITEDTLYRWIRINSDDLTKIAYLNIIRRELGLNDESLLENNQVAA